MRYMCCQPAIKYYTWQIEVMIDNFISSGIDPTKIDILCAYKISIPDDYKKLQEKYSSVNFYFYKDERTLPTYISSIRPFILHQHWLHHPELEKETIFYHDCDIMFSKPIDFSALLHDEYCYVSDTKSYIGAKYIRSKGEHYLDIMSEIVGLDKQVIIDNEENSGGAQYLIKQIPTEFWEKVYRDSERLFYLVNAQIKLDNPPHAIQIWCADMWAVLWNLWLIGKGVKITDELSFSWATSPISHYDKHPIYHNAGVTGDRKDLFFKGAYLNILPYNEISLSNYNDRFCAFKYAEQILKTKQTTCLK